jgi:hypothetical protein
MPSIYKIVELPFAVKVTRCQLLSGKEEVLSTGPITVPLPCLRYPEIIPVFA